MLFQLVLLLLTGSLLNDKADAKLLQIIRVDGSCRGKNTQMQSFFVGIKPIASNKLLITNSTIVVKEDLGNDLVMSVSLDRCSSMENLDSCEAYHKHKNIDYCKLISPENTLKPFQFAFSPPFRCPLVKGTYKAFNTTGDTTPYMIFLTEGWYWKIKLETFLANTNKLTSCLKVDLRVLQK